MDVPYRGMSRSATSLRQVISSRAAITSSTDRGSNWRLIAAIAMASHMTIVTRNIKYFEPLAGVDLHNPWELERGQDQNLCLELCAESVLSTSPAEY